MLTLGFLLPFTLQRPAKGINNFIGLNGKVKGEFKKSKLFH